MDKNGALDIIGLLAKAWADKTEGDVAHAFAQIAGLAGEAGSEGVDADVCPACFGDCERLYNNGLMRKCTVCKGTGKRRQ